MIKSRVFNKSSLKKLSNKKSLIKDDRSGLFNQKTRDIFQVIGVTTGIATLTFQTTVLYPWHERLSEDILELENRVEMSSIIHIVFFCSIILILNLDNKIK